MKIKNSKIITGETIKKNEKKKNEDCACEFQHDKKTELNVSGDCACDAFNDRACTTV